MSTYLDTYLTKGNKEPWEEKKTLLDRSCLDPSTAESYPVLGSGSARNASSTSHGSSIDTLSQTYSGNEYINPNPNAGMTSQFDILSALHTANGGGAMITDEPQQAHISPQSRDTPNSFVYLSGSGSGSGSISYGGSSKTTPESANLVDPMPTYFDVDSTQFMSFEKGQFTGLGNMPSGAYPGQ